MRAKAQAAASHAGQTYTADNWPVPTEHAK